MSVIPVGERSADPSGVETYDSGDDWEIGVGDLIIDLDADLEKDRQKLEMNRLGSAKGSTKEYEGMGSAGRSRTLRGGARDHEPGAGPGGRRRARKRRAVRQRQGGEERQDSEQEREEGAGRRQQGQAGEAGCRARELATWQRVRAGKQRQSVRQRRRRRRRRHGEERRGLWSNGQRWCGQEER
ncbi:hypothetical protein Z043_112298 [Scleropages formosus]|uniref:Uncharacterized protein n=1 Tax=Scleropages formosus TaxID=113540 RepID=A0A0P7U4D6_SCLFO|nr:hypothetical protein Z043_112298 [Scleropages formosus]